jgi:hypothetical protein
MTDQKLPMAANYAQTLLQAEKEFQCDNIEAALEHCTTVIEVLLPYAESLRKKKIPRGKSTTKVKSKSAFVNSSDYALQSSTLGASSIEYDPVKSLSIGELTELITNPPGCMCSEAKFGKVFAIYGYDFACAIFKMIKGTSVPSLESLARWSMIGILENYCHNIIACGNTPRFDDGPDPVLFCPVHDSGERRFDDGAVYPTTTTLSNLVKKFVLDLDICYQLQVLLLPSILGHPADVLPVGFHTDLSVKQKLFSVASYNGDWLNSSFVDSILKEHQCLHEDLAILYATACLKRAHCHFVTNQYSQCAEEAGAILKVQAELPSSIRARASLLKARSLFRVGVAAKKAALLETKESDIWRAQLQYLQSYRTAAQSFAYTLQLMNESEFNSEMHECNVEMVLCLHEVFTAYRSDCQLKTCCLCWKNTHICGSHIFPRFILEMLSSEAGILVGSELKGPKQVRFPMLCNECEQRFCNWGENSFKSLFVDKVLEQPGRKLEISHGYWFYYFFASLIWRLYFQFQYKAANFSEMLKVLPMFAMRKFLLSGNIQHLTADCFLYLYIDKDEFDDEVLCSMSRYKSYARRGGGCSFDPDESVFICSFLNYYLAFPVGKIRNSFLMQGSLKRLKFGEGVFEIAADPQRIIPVFLERYICEIAREYDNALSGLTHQTHSRISRSFPERGNHGTSSGTNFLPNVIRCLPKGVSVTFNPNFKYGIELQGGCKVKHPPMDCKLAGELEKRYTLYVCAQDEGIPLALYRVHGSGCDHVYAFQFSVTDDGEIDYFSPCENIRNKQYFEMLLKSNPALPDFLKTVVFMVILTEAPPLELHFFPEGAEKHCLVQPDGDLFLPPQSTVIGNPVTLKNMTLWLCEFENSDTIAILRLFSEIMYDEVALYDYLVALQFQTENGKVTSFSPLHLPHEESEADREILGILLEFQSILTDSIQLLHDPSFQKLGVVCCLENEMYIDFIPISAATSTDNLVVLNALGTVVDPVFEFHSWLCSCKALVPQKSCLVVLEKWKIANLLFTVLFTLQPSDKDVLHVASLSSLPGAPFTSVFMKMVKDYCLSDFNAITRNVVLGVQACLKVNSRVRSIFTTSFDPLMKREESSDESSMVVEETTLPLGPIFCLPSSCEIIETELLELSSDYSLLCPPLKTPLYTVWLCAYKDTHELIIVKTTSGIEDLCSCAVVTLNFVASKVCTGSGDQFRFYPFLHLNADEIDFVQEYFLESATFQNSDPQFHVLEACVQILLSQLYQSHSLQVYLPSKFQVGVSLDGELQLVHPRPFLAGPLCQETPVMALTCWLCEEGLGIVKIENKVTECQYITALTFEYTGTVVSNLELVELPSGLKFLVQNHLYSELNSSFLLSSLFRNLCNHFVMGD